MAKEKPTTKTCKHCKTEIPYDAKVCPQCRKKQGMGCLPMILIAVAVIVVIAMLGGTGEDEKTSGGNETSSTSEKIEYKKYSADDLIKDIDKNAAKASKTYKDQYLEVTGELSNIDSDMSYISIIGSDEFALVNIQCFVQTEEQEEQILEMSIGDKVTIKGKCTDVGELLGYTIDIDSISK